MERKFINPQLCSHSEGSYLTETAPPPHWKQERCKICNKWFKNVSKPKKETLPGLKIIAKNEEYNPSEHTNCKVCNERLLPKSIYSYEGFRFFHYPLSTERGELKS